MERASSDHIGLSGGINREEVDVPMWRRHEAQNVLKLGKDLGLGEGEQRTSHSPQGSRQLRSWIFHRRTFDAGSFMGSCGSWPAFRRARSFIAGMHL